MKADSRESLNSLCDVTPKDVETLYSNHEKQLRQKIDATRDAYFGFIFPMERGDFKAVQSALGIDEATGRKL